MALEIRFYSFFQNIKYFQTEKPDLLHCCNFFILLLLLFFVITKIISLLLLLLLCY